MYYQLTQARAVQSTTLDALHDQARRVAAEMRQTDGQAWTTLHFQECDGDRVCGEGSFNVEQAAPMNTVWYWRET